jgi:hypothetical protein
MYERVFGEGSVYVVDFGDLVKQPLEEVNKLLQWLEADQVDTLEEARNDNSTASRSPLESSVIGPIRPILAKMPDRYKTTLAQIFRPMFSKVSRKPKHEKLTEQQRQDIHNQLAPGMARLAQRGMVDVSKWGFENS